MTTHGVNWVGGILCRDLKMVNNYRTACLTITRSLKEEEDLVSLLDGSVYTPFTTKTLSIIGIILNFFFCICIYLFLYF